MNCNHVGQSNGCLTEAVCLAQHSARPNVILSGASDGCVCVWDMRNDRRALMRLAVHDGAVRAMTFARHGERLASVGDDGCCLLWHTASLLNGVADDVGRVEQLHSHETPLLSVAANDSDDTLVCGAESGALFHTTAVFSGSI